MLEAMFQAEVGDDVFGQDPTVNALQEKAAAMFGMEAALFCPSGTMTNQIAFKISTQPMEMAILDTTAHPYRYEGGGLAFTSGLTAGTVVGERGIFTAEQVLARMNPVNDPHQPPATIVSIENTCNKGGGAVYPFDGGFGDHSQTARRRAAGPRSKARDRCDQACRLRTPIRGARNRERCCA